MKFTTYHSRVILALAVIAFGGPTSAFEVERDLAHRISIHHFLRRDPQATICPPGTYLCQDSQGGCCGIGTVCLPYYKCSGPPPPEVPPPSPKVPPPPSKVPPPPSKIGRASCRERVY